MAFLFAEQHAPNRRHRSMAITAAAIAPLPRAIGGEGRRGSVASLACSRQHAAGYARHTCGMHRGRRSVTGRGRAEYERPKPGNDRPRHLAGLSTPEYPCLRPCVALNHSNCVSGLSDRAPQRKCRGSRSHLRAPTTPLCSTAQSRPTGALAICHLPSDSIVRPRRPAKRDRPDLSGIGLA